MEQPGKRLSVLQRPKSQGLKELNDSDLVQSIHSPVSSELVLHQSASDSRQKEISILPKWRLLLFSPCGTVAVPGADYT